MKNSSSDPCFNLFEKDINIYTLPDKFTFPFYYDPHPLCLLAANELQSYIKNKTEWTHNFGLDTSKEGLVIGKMFGVLLVKDWEGNIGYLSAFSGKLTNINHDPKFVPHVFNMSNEDSYFSEGMKKLKPIGNKLKKLETNSDHLKKLKKFKKYKQWVEKDTNNIREQLIKEKAVRKILRMESIKNDSPEIQQTLEKELIEQSLKSKFYFRELKEYYSHEIKKYENELMTFLLEIDQLKTKRKKTSIQLQNYLFEQYHFLDYNGNIKSLLDIFIKKKGIQPPSGSGECAAPKLLQYAYLNKYQPIAMAEFWWGQSPKSEIRKHKQFYPACRGKCEPILAHMLKGLEVEDNPLIQNNAVDKQMETIFEDDYILIINKPPELLTVPGKTLKDSVYTRIKKERKDISGPIIVHRLDMSTSGLVLIPKSKEIHKSLQQQFIKKTIRKRYVAILDGNIHEKEGTIELPLRLDLDDRPRQLVCYDHGKQAKTNWEVIKTGKNITMIYFYPITGRTHQLRVHASHVSGLNSPIKGDDLYGQKGDRLYLHAERLEFIHPITKELKTITSRAPFVDMF